MPAPIFRDGTDDGESINGTLICTCFAILRDFGELQHCLEEVRNSTFRINKTFACGGQLVGEWCCYGCRICWAVLENASSTGCETSRSTDHSAHCHSASSCPPQANVLLMRKVLLRTSSKQCCSSPKSRRIAKQVQINVPLMLSPSSVPSRKMGAG